MVNGAMNAIDWNGLRIRSRKLREFLIFWLRSLHWRHRWTDRRTGKTRNAANNM